MFMLIVFGFTVPNHSGLFRILVPPVESRKKLFAIGKLVYECEKFIVVQDQYSGKHND